MSSEYGGFLVDNVAPDATISMTNEDSNFPKGRCVNGNSVDPTIASTTSCKIRFAFASAQAITAVALIGHNMENADTIKCNVYDAATWDPGDLVTANDLEPSWYRRWIWKIDENGILQKCALSNIYLVIDNNEKWYEIELSGASNPRVAEVILGTSQQLGANFTWGYERIFEVAGNITESNNVITGIQSNERFNYNLPFTRLTEAQLEVLDDLARLKGRNKVFVPDMDQYKCFFGEIVSKAVPAKDKYNYWSTSLKWKESTL